MKEAMFYEKMPQQKVHCNLCYRECIIAPGNFGVCGIRKNIDGTLYALTYSKAAAYEVDPIEKKPFYHFYPGSTAFSFATAGCNFHCLHCCNPNLSQSKAGEVPESDISPKQMVEMAKNSGSSIIAYTYTEPTVFFEYCYDTGIIARKQGMKNVFVSNGYAQPEVVKKSTQFLDAIRIDLKGDEKHYREVCGGIQLNKVLECIKNYYKPGMHLEIITLVIPKDNDNKDTVIWMADFLKSLGNRGKDIAWHFIAFFPTWKMKNIPPTTPRTLEKMYNWAKEQGMNYPYVGNMRGRLNNTYCPKCERLLIEREWPFIKVHLPKNKKCPNCSTKIPIIGEF